ncbi:sushi, von Willebrand factor type A, EGF and pentraxin domain-containing protein 1-like [Anneissia japonica]|uniref:sushi, von Willebrand factor type A, EGF and pentraxin domain-containing protein 1-like n=1 Tax=Anneissia japonica TaxID=1529436 RepID=UPI0014255FEF|nr:sushi, von Willebrand factor type A, EGF and pentraxin domain-containing protein 1-like [Anneissia japonica]
MTRLAVLTIAFLATIKSGLANESCPFDEQAVDDTGRRCTREAACTGESDKADCKGKRRCRCDDICGFICIKVFQDNYCNEDDLPPSTIGLTYELSRDPIRFGTTATYSCGIGYEMSNSSLNVRICRGDGRWSGQTPTCLTSIACTAPAKVQRAMHNGRDENGNDRQLYAVGEKLKYSCNAGYYPIGSGFIYCQKTESDNAAWSDLDPNFECRPKSCGSPGTISNGYRVGNVFSFSKEVTFHCNEGYRIQGRSYRVCQADGEWSGFTPVCIPVLCPSLTDPENGEVFGMDYTFGERVKLDCDVGFVVPATDGLRSVYTYCQANGQWDKSVQCEAVNCGDPGEPRNGNRNGDNFGYNGYILFSCDADYQLVGEKSIYCQENNKWSAERPSCFAECVLPEVPMHLEVPPEYNPGERVIFGTRYDISCEKGYTLNSDNGIWECIGGEMSFDPVCNENSCPPPANIKDGYITYSSKSVSGLYIPFTIATYNCNDGFKLSRSGKSSRRCREGKFKASAPTCTETICTIPTVHHSNNDASNVILKHGQSVTYTCNDGYYSEDVLQLTCENERFTHDPPVCRESPCPGISSDHLQVEYDNPATTTVNGLHVYEAGTIATILCDSSNIYYPSEPEATCQLGQFKPQVTCKKYATCLSEEVTHATVSYKDETVNNYIPEDGHVRQGVTRAVQCTNPYKIKGKSKSVCTNSGQWSENIPSCEKQNEFDSKNLCKLHTNPDSGWFSYSDSLKPGSKIRLGCFGLPYIQTIPGFERTCVRDTNPGSELNYKWSPDISELPQCILDTDSECRSEVVRGGSQSFKASSLSSKNRPTHGRLYARDGAWIPKNQEVGQWLEVDLDHSMDVYGVRTQGNYGKKSWVTLYKVAYREKDESPESFVNNENEEEAVSIFLLLSRKTFIVLNYVILLFYIAELEPRTCSTLNS